MIIKREKISGNAEALQRASDAANKKRKARVAKKEREERLLRAEIAKAYDEAIIINKVFDDEKAMWEAKAKAKGRKGSMKVIADGIEFPSLNAALRAMEPLNWGEETAYRKSCWTRINRNLKKKGTFIDMGHEFILI